MKGQVLCQMGASGGLSGASLEVGDSDHLQMFGALAMGHIGSAFSARVRCCEMVPKLIDLVLERIVVGLPAPVSALGPSPPMKFGEDMSRRRQRDAQLHHL